VSLLTYLTQADIRDAAVELDGKVLTRPALLVTDGSNLIYAVDVDIGVGAPLKNVPIARGNRDLLYADAGNACRLRRSESGQYQVIGFSKELPGTYTRVCVHIDSAALGAITDMTISGHVVTLGELADFGAGFGSTPLEAVAIYQGSTLLELRIP
jgi:hypothetical protein